MTLPENARTLHANELPPLGSPVYVPENTAPLAGGRPAPGWQNVLATDDSESTIAVKSENGRISWVLSHNLLVENDANVPPPLTVGDTVIIDAPGEKYHGMIGTLAEDDETDLPYFVRFLGGAEWFTPEQVMRSDLAPAHKANTTTTTGPALVAIRHETIVTLPLPATAKQVTDALSHIHGHHEVTVTTYADHIEILAHHEEPRG